MKNEIITIRASSLGRLFDCPASWAATHIEGKKTPSSGKAVLGTAVHKSTAVYDQSVLDGSALSISDAEAAAVDAIYKPTYEVDWGDDKQQDVETIARALHNKYCSLIAPTQTYIGVEVDCQRLEISDIGIALTGTTDRVRRTEEGLSICDIKTGKTAVSAAGSVNTSGHAYQLGVYQLLAEHALGEQLSDSAQIIGLNTAKTDAAQRVGVGEIKGARDLLLGDGEKLGILEYAANIVNTGNFYPNPKSMMCGEKYCAAWANCKARR